MKNYTCDNYKTYKLQEETELHDPSTTNWVNILVPLKDKHILKIGTKRLRNIKSILNFDCASLTCVGSDRFDFHTTSLTYIQSLEFLKKAKFDLCLIDEFDFLPKTFSLKHIKKILFDISKLLNDTGTLLIGLPNGFHKIKHKLLIKKILNKVGFKKLDTFFCVPSFYEPLTIYPFSQDPKYSFKILSDNFFNEMNPMSFIKDFIKCVLLKIAPMLSPFLGVMLIARKSSDGNEETFAENILIANFPNKPIKRHNIYSVWFAKPYVGKQIGHFHYIENFNKKLFAICKQSNNKYYRSYMIKQEYENISLISIYRDELKANKIIIPQPIYFEVSNGKIISIESALLGESLSNSKFKKKLSKSRQISYHKSILDELVKIQIFLQDLLTKRLKDQLPQIPERYFNNSLSLPYEGFNNIERIESYKLYVQHGDFTDVNILCDDSNKMWSIIDWEWLASGFPYLYDLFYLFISLEFRENHRNTDYLFDHYFNSVVDTFFKKNWFSDYVRIIAISYCNYFNLDNKQAFDWFLDFLLFHYNKYLSDYNDQGYADLFRKLLLYSITNKEHFILHLRMR